MPLAALTPSDVHQGGRLQEPATARGLPDGRPTAREGGSPVKVSTVDATAVAERSETWRRRMSAPCRRRG